MESFTNILLSSLNLQKRKNKGLSICLCSRSKSAKDVTAEHGTTRENLYKWKRQLLKAESVHSINNKKSNKTINTHSTEAEVSELRSEKDNLSSQIAELKKEVHHLKIEHVIYEKAWLTRSMYKKGCSPDNSTCKGCFGRLKNEMFYDCSWTSIIIEQFIEDLNKYIKRYAEKQIKLSLGGMSPLDYRRSLGFVV